MSTAPHIGELIGRSVVRACVYGAALLLVAVTRPALGSDAYTYTKVADFDNTTIGLCDFAINDNGDVAYVAQTIGGQNTRFDVHLWIPSGSDSVVYSVTTTGSDGAWAPDCGGFGGGSLGVAINNNRLISIEAQHLTQIGADAYGALFVDASITPSPAPVLVQTPTIFYSTSLLNSSGARGVLINTFQGTEIGSVSPAGPKLDPLSPRKIWI